MQGRLLSVNPLVTVFDDVFGAEVAQAAIAAGRDHLRPSTYGTRDGIVTGEKRTNFHAILDPWSVPELASLVTKVSSIVRLPPENAEPAKLLRYEGEQLIDAHFDAYTDDLIYRELLSRGGQRLFTTICYLNDVEAEGTTAFPLLKLAVRPRLGRVLVFSNTVPGETTPHQDSKHIGFGPGTGTKWVLSLWWRQRIYHEPRVYPETQGDFSVF